MKIKYLGLSVAGTSHILTNTPCQDAWAFKETEQGIIAVICDGLGSKTYSDKGAQMATQAALNVWVDWIKNPKISPTDVLSLLEEEWLNLLGEISPSTAATTCLFYFQEHEGRCFFAQLGDGMIAKISKDETYVHPYMRHDFGFTSGLGVQHNLNDWSLIEVSPLLKGEIVLLLSDGISDDLEKEDISGFSNYIIGNIVPQKEALSVLKKEMEEWESSDDKTILIVWRVE